MTDWRLPPTSLTELQPPDSRAAIERTFAGYKKTLESLSPDQLMEHLTAINGQLELQQRALVSAVLSPSEVLSASIASLDRPVLRSTPTAIQSPQPRGLAAQVSPSHLPPRAVDLLASSSRLGPRLAAKLVAASARSRSMRERG